MRNSRDLQLERQCASALGLRTSVRCLSAIQAGGRIKEKTTDIGKGEKHYWKKEAIVTLFLFHSRVSLEADEKWKRGGRSFFAPFNVDLTHRLINTCNELRFQNSLRDFSR